MIYIENESSLFPVCSSYDGDVYEGMRHGFGVFRCKNNKMSYHGDWALGKKHGKVIFCFVLFKLDFESGEKKYVLPLPRLATLSIVKTVSFSKLYTCKIVKKPPCATYITTHGL